MKNPHAVALGRPSRKWGEYAEERCPHCGRFVEADASGFYDREDREDECSGVLVFCSENHADLFHEKQKCSCAR